MIDLSFLSEEEQETILTVLNRDAELKKAEEKRVQNLKKTITDKRKLRYLTGEWFYETKQRRHQDRIHGSDIIKASMRQSLKPLTILELTHILPAKPSFGSSEHKDMFVPAVLRGLLEEPDGQPSRDGNQIHNNDENVHDKTVLQSPVKMRKNPFNTDLTSEEKKNQVAESRLSPDRFITTATDPKENVGINLVNQEASVQVEKPENRVTRISSQETFANVKGSDVKSSAAQFSVSEQDPQSPGNWSTEMCVDSKKVILPSDWQDGRDPGEHSLVNIKITPCEEYSSDSGNDNSTSTGTQELFRRQSPKDSQEGYGDISSPLFSALKRLSSRNMSSSKSLENLTSQTTSASIKSKTMPSSCSAFDLQKDEVDNDITFQKNPSSSMSDLRLSSRLASVSSMSSSRSSLSADITIQGSIQFAVNYIQKLGELQIFVVLCRALATGDPKKNRSDPYVKCYLLPDKTQLGKRKTSVRKKTVNPSYNEILRFKIPMADLKSQTLNISVWHNDSFGRNSFLGEVDLDLSEWDFNNTEINEYTLKSRVPPQIPAPSNLPLTGSQGQMRVALKYVAQAFHGQSGSGLDGGELMVWVKDCRNLPPVRGVVINPFVKCVVLPDMSKRSRQKTRVVKKTANPLFNHTMVYDGFRPQDLRETCVELTVWDHERLSNHFIGGVRLGLGTGRSYDVEVAWMDSTTNEATLWQRMFQSVGEWVEDILPLRMLVMAKVTSK